MDKCGNIAAPQPDIARWCAHIENVPRRRIPTSAGAHANPGLRAKQAVCAPDATPALASRNSYIQRSIPNSRRIPVTAYAELRHVTMYDGL